MIKLKWDMYMISFHWVAANDCLITHEFLQMVWSFLSICLFFICVTGIFPDFFTDNPYGENPSTRVARETASSFYKQTCFLT